MEDWLKEKRGPLYKILRVVGRQNKMNEIYIFMSNALEKNHKIILSGHSWIILFGANLWMKAQRVKRRKLGARWRVTDGVPTTPRSLGAFLCCKGKLISWYPGVGGLALFHKTWHCIFLIIDPSFLVAFCHYLLIIIYVMDSFNKCILAISNEQGILLGTKKTIIYKTIVSPVLMEFTVW